MNRFFSHTCNLATGNVEFALAVVEVAACKRIVGHVDSERNFLSADGQICRLFDAFDARRGHYAVKRLYVCDIRLLALLVERYEHRRAAECVAPFARLEVIGRILCEIDRIDAVCDFVDCVRLLIYRAFVITYISKCFFEDVKFSLVIRIRSHVRRNVAYSLVVEEVDRLDGLLLDAEFERYRLCGVDCIAVLVHFAAVDKREFRTVFRAIKRRVGFDLCVNRAAVKDILFCFEFRASRVGVVLHRAPVGEHSMRRRAEGYRERLISLILVPGRVERVFVFYVERKRRGLECVYFNRDVNFLRAAVIRADCEFCIERIRSLIGVSLVCDLVGREVVYAVVVCVVVGFARFDERRFHSESVADGQSLFNLVAACVFDVEHKVVAKRCHGDLVVRILVEGDCL